MTTLLRCLKHYNYSKTRSEFTSITLITQSIYGASRKSSSIQILSKTNFSTFNDGNRNSLPYRKKWVTNTLHVDFIELSRRHFSLKDTMESAFTTHTSVFKTISDSSIVQYTQNCIINLHETTGLPWWLTIVVVTCLVRGFLTLPLAVYQSYVVARLENITKEMSEITNNLRYDIEREVRKNKLSGKEARRHLLVTSRKEWKRLIERDNCHPAKASILAIIQIPTWVIFSTAFRNLVYMLPHQDAAAAVTRLGLSLGGLPWCTDLTVPDSFIIPIALGLTNLVIVEVQAMMYQGQSTKLRRFVSNFFRGFAVFMIPVAATVPSAVSLYWLSSSVFGLCQNLLVVSPRMRRLCNFPPTPSYNPHPYAHLAQQIRRKINGNKTL